MLRFKRFLKQRYYRLRQWYPIWRYWVNRQGYRWYKKHPSVLDSVGERILVDLNHDGIAIASLDELFPGTDWLSRLRSYVETKRPTAKPQVSKPFLLQLWDNKSSTIDFTNPFVSLALSEKLLEIVNAYLKLAARFYFLEGSITLPVTDSNAPKASQRWHRDPEDPTMCKVFFYLSDVTPDTGPFHYILGSQHGGRYGRLFPQQPPTGVYPPDGMVEAVVDQKDIKMCTGKAGTIIFCDTAGFHRGGYAVIGERWMFTSGYSSPRSLWPARYQTPTPENINRLGPLARQALN